MSFGRRHPWGDSPAPDGCGIVPEMSERFYINCQLQPGLEVELTGAEAHHLLAACRLRPGDTVCLFNGDGREYPALVAQVQRRSCQVLIQGCETPGRELPFSLAMAVPLPKGDRAQFLIEKCTELGVTSFIPLLTRRSVILPGESRLEKLQRYVVEASKQCRRNILMRIETPQPWPALCPGSADNQIIKTMAHPGGLPLSRPTGNGMARNVLLAVGPEGGWTEEELELGRASGWQLLALGPRVLRVETAALVMASWAAAGLFHG